uniref:39S ribosomal protein L41, mitochondrial n=1 Tax=Angiostrongylus cantonensis TaxID=6313 RepID=A0A0K0CXR7_ANGCA
MVFRKYRPTKQWGKMDTRIFKAILKARNNRKMQAFHVPAAVKAAGITVCDPNEPSFFTPIIRANTLPDLRETHPAFRVPSIEVTFFPISESHPLYHKARCFLFDGSVPMSDGIDQAAVLSKAIVKTELPETVIHNVGHLDISEDVVRDAILHGEKYDPTLEKLPRRFDPVLFWVYHPVVYGTPVLNAFLVLSYYRLSIDRDEPISGTLPNIGSFTENPFVLRFQPDVCLQGSRSITPWCNRREVEELPSIAPLSPLIDLRSEHIYNESSVVPRPNAEVSLHTVLWSREQNQKYPWTKWVGIHSNRTLCYYLQSLCSLVLVDMVVLSLFCITKLVIFSENKMRLMQCFIHSVLL